MSSALWELVQSGLTDRQIGEQLGLTKDQVRHKRVALRAEADSPTRENTPLLEIPPRPFAVKIPDLAQSWTPEGIQRGIILPDTHVPFECKKAVEITNRIMHDFDPHAVVHIGDILDAGRLSMKFPTDPKRIDTLQADIDAVRVLLHQWAQITPHAKRWLLEGNHEQRLTRLVWGMEGPVRELAKLRDFQQTMTWPHLFRLNESGWEWVAYDDQPRADILPHLLVKHGSFVSQEGGMTAKREWTKYGKSGASGHTHRANVWRHRDYNGQATWIEAGCLCRYDVPGASDPNWQQAVTLVEWSADHSVMNVEQVLIRDGKAVWRGREMAA